MEWQLIETVPKDGTLILLIRQGFTPTIGMWHCGEVHGGHHQVLISISDDFILKMDSARYDPTHWMPLPNPPKV